MTIYFYSTRSNYRYFSNFYYHSFELDGEYRQTTEHYFQTQKMRSRLIWTKLVRQKYVSNDERVSAIKTAAKAHAKLK